MQGLGYGGYDDRRGLGIYRGEQHVEHDVWDVSHPTDVVRPSKEVKLLLTRPAKLMDPRTHVSFNHLVQSVQVNPF